jgi:hypothetical protein
VGKPLENLEKGQEMKSYYETLKEASNAYDALISRDGDVWVLESGMSGSYCVRPRLETDPRPKSYKAVK